MNTRPGGRLAPGAGSRPGGARGVATGSPAGALARGSGADTGRDAAHDPRTAGRHGDVPTDVAPNAAFATNATGGATATPVLAVLEDCAAGALVIECSAALARTLGRALQLVHVQSALALQAAALPQTQVLAHAGAPWAPFAPQDVERGWRAQAARLQALAGPIATRHALRWSLRTVRGEIGAVARGLFDETDLIFLGAMAWRTHSVRSARSVRSAPGGGLAPPGLLVVLNDGSAAAQRAARLATHLAAAMPTAWRVHEWPVADTATLDAMLQRPPPLDALVLPRALATRERWARLARLGCPVLLIG